jgi:LysR family glycine cleavage system transcriptional activator
MIAHKIFGADFTPMLSPALAASIGGVNSPEDLLKLPIVDPSDPWWKLWFEAADITALDFRGDPRSRFGDQHLEGKAVIAGQGVGILTPMFYVSELKQGLLLQPFDIVGTTDHFYWLVYPEARRNLPKIRAFRDWLLSQLKSD